MKRKTIFISKKVAAEIGEFVITGLSGHGMLLSAPAARAWKRFRESECEATFKVVKNKIRRIK
jgi:hypothetical protein